MTLSFSFTRTAFAVAAVLLIYSGGLLLWQMANQPSSTGCYWFPAGTFTLMPFLELYRGDCPFNTLPNFYAGDVGLILIVFGTVLSLVGMRVGRKTVEVEV